MFSLIPVLDVICACLWVEVKRVLSVKRREAVSWKERCGESRLMRQEACHEKGDSRERRGAR